MQKPVSGRFKRWAFTKVHDKPSWTIMQINTINYKKNLNR